MPETVLEGAKRSLKDGLERVRISKEDVQVYGKRSYVPIDICLLVDCSASMAGDKSQAAAVSGVSAALFPGAGGGSRISGDERPE